MGQLCCFPFSQAEEKISGGRRSEPDEAELLRVSKRLVEDAISRVAAVQTGNTAERGGPNAAAVQPSVNAGETKTDTTANSSTDNRK